MMHLALVVTAYATACVLVAWTLVILALVALRRRLDRIDERERLIRRGIARDR